MYDSSSNSSTHPDPRRPPYIANNTFLTNAPHTPVCPYCLLRSCLEWLEVCLIQTLAYLFLGKYRIKGINFDERTHTSQNGTRFLGKASQSNDHNVCRLGLHLNVYFKSKFTATTAVCDLRCSISFFRDNIIGKFAEIPPRVCCCC